MPALGIGIITFNRHGILAETIRRVRALTQEPDTLLMVADDGSTDGTLEMLAGLGVPVATGANRGIAWNKNRALFTLSRMLGCETVLLLEDDAWPDTPGWDRDWIAATRRWGHVSCTFDGLALRFHAGSGTPEDPYICGAFSAQCCGYSRAALMYGGYFDSRFHGFGHEHVEHTARLGRVGFGIRLFADAGTDPGDGPKNGFVMIGSGLSVQHPPSHAEPEQIARNLQLAHDLMQDHGYRVPWRDHVEMRQFRSEVNAALQAREAAFRLPRPAPARTPPPAPGLRFVGSA